MCESQTGRLTPTNFLAPNNYSHKAGDGLKTRKRYETEIHPALQAQPGSTQATYLELQVEPFGVLRVKPKVIGGIGEKNFGKQYRQGNRIYDGSTIATALESQPVGHTGGNSNLYSVEIAKGGIVDTNMGNTTDDDKKDGLFVEISPKLTVYAVWYPKKQCYIAIRKLTPKECFRLQGWSDDYFEKAQFVCSDSQLYKQAGNGVTVSVVYEIAKRLKEGESNAKENDGTD